MERCFGAYMNENVHRSKFKLLDKKNNNSSLHLEMRLSGFRSRQGTVWSQPRVEFHQAPTVQQHSAAGFRLHLLTIPKIEK